MTSHKKTSTAAVATRMNAPRSTSSRCNVVQIDFAPLMEPVALALLGAPNELLSCGRDLRFGTRGSLHVNLAVGTFFDFEANEGGGVLDLIDMRLGLRGRDAFAWMRSERILDRAPPNRPVAPRGKPNREDAQGTTFALRTWRQSGPATGTTVESYLRSRGITVPPPPTLRFHPGLRHQPSGTVWPAMVAAVAPGRSRVLTAIHRTYLARDGAGKAPVEPTKMAIGPVGGGAVRLAPAAGLLMVGEGIETCLAAMTATGLPAWAALSTSGLRALDPPDDVQEVIVLADGDEPGEAAARDCAVRWKREGRRVRIARPPRGCDFNDVLGQAEVAP